ncbi:LOW QUALITY PROTEIN: hypothetical protein M8C21_016118, partial [Ambrosia artemisiifolia]
LQGKIALITGAASGIGERTAKLFVEHGAKLLPIVMVPARAGSIISTASLASNIGGASSHAYSSSKHAVVGLTKNLAVELGQFGIRVNCLSPYAMVTPLATRFVGLDDDEALENFVSSCGNLKGVTLKTDDVANAALFLASEEAKYISGHNLNIDGGVSIFDFFGKTKHYDVLKIREDREGRTSGWRAVLIASGALCIRCTFFNRGCNPKASLWDLLESTLTYQHRTHLSSYIYLLEVPLVSSNNCIRGALKRLAGKVALITGAASGLGECTAKLFAEHGAKVILADIQDELSHGVCEAIGSTNSRFVHCDVSKEKDVINAVDTAIATYGKLDIAFNNAAIVDPVKQSIIDNDKIDFDHVLSVNVTGVFLGMKHAARVMLPARSGSIISTSSVASHMGGTISHAYTCSKHA